jgi:epoxide hydrolase-like predicted phosphatase
MIKAIIFDFFGVLGTKGLRQFKKDNFANSPGKIKESKQLQRELDTGKLGYNKFIDGLAALAGVNKDEVLKYTEEYKPNTELLNYIRAELKPKYKIAIISNAGLDWVIKIIGESNQKLFDDIILSYKVGTIKPEPKIYEMSAKNLSVKPSECVFVDDISTYCGGAEAVGMKSIWYRNFKQFKAELEKILTPGPDN